MSSNEWFRPMKKAYFQRLGRGSQVRSKMRGFDERCKTFEAEKQAADCEGNIIMKEVWENTKALRGL